MFDWDKFSNYPTNFNFADELRTQETAAIAGMRKKVLFFCSLVAIRRLVSVAPSVVNLLFFLQLIFLREEFTSRKIAINCGWNEW